MLHGKGREDPRRVWGARLAVRGVPLGFGLLS